MKKVIVLLLMLIIGVLFLGMITPNNTTTKTSELSIEMEDEEYVDDIPFDTKEIVKENEIINKTK